MSGSSCFEEVSLYFLGGGPIQYFGLDPIDPRSSSFFIRADLRSFSPGKESEAVLCNIQFHCYILDPY